MCGIGKVISKTAGACASGVSNFFSTVASYSTPYHRVITVTAFGTGVYLKLLTDTYGPGVLAELCIQATIRAVGNVTIGRAFGIACVAPSFVPQAMPYFSPGVGLIGGYFVMVVMNIIAKKVFGIEPIDKELEKLVEQNRQRERELESQIKAGKLQKELAIPAKGSI